MENELKGIKYILFVIALVLLFGAGAIRESIGTIFWIFIVIGVIVLILIGFGTLFGDGSRQQHERKMELTDEEKEAYEEADKAHFEETNPGWERKKFLGSTVDMNKVDYGNWKVIILTTIGLFVLMFIIGAIASRF